MADHDVIVAFSARELSRDLISQAQEHLIDELNERGPIADMILDDVKHGSKGATELVGQVGLALLSANVLKYIAQVLVEFVKRNDRLVVKVGDIEITKDHASEGDKEAIYKLLSKILKQRESSQHQ
jgi:hypothetical protein